MNLSSFKESLSETSPPASLSLYLTALWYDAKGNWNAAHELIDDIEDKQAAWVHAYLHRSEVISTTLLAPVSPAGICK